ncbi:MAG TPA: hypothetical protein VIX41_08840 [Acidimicrobiales bacterium]
MRAGDIAPPAVVPHPLPPDSPMAAWPAQLRIAIEMLPQAAYVWDDADPTVLWDDPDPDRLVWDAPFIGSGFTDVICDLHALETVAGEPDELGVFGPGTTILTLANPDGRYSAWTADGRLVYFAPGRRMCLFADIAGEPWWIASLRIDRWSPQADGTVLVEASDGFSLLARERGTYTPGTAGQTPLARIQAIAAVASFPDTVRGDPGDVTLTRQATDRSPLEEIQIVALSDAGIVAVDADGALTYRNRLWPAGRDDQAGELVVFTDNVCTVDHVVWDLELAAADDALANDIRLTNVAGLVATATDTSAMFGLVYPLTHPDPDQWTTQAEGNAVAAALHAQRSTPRAAIAEFTLNLHDPRQDLWRAGIDLRLGDRIRFISEQAEPAGGTDILDLVAIVSTIRHQILPDQWTVTVGTTRTVDYVAIERWDETRFVWDDPDPLAVWRY